MIPQFMRHIRDESLEVNRATQKQIDFIKEFGYNIEDIEFSTLSIDEAFEIIKEIEDFWIEIECNYYMEDVGDR